ncbi:hypothetical protein Bca101_091256 [Brassica carinata]
MPSFFGIDLRVVNSSRSYIFIVFMSSSASMASPTKDRIPPTKSWEIAIWRLWK